MWPRKKLQRPRKDLMVLLSMGISQWWAFPCWSGSILTSPELMWNPMTEASLVPSQVFSGLIFNWCCSRRAKTCARFRTCCSQVWSNRIKRLMCTRVPGNFPRRWRSVASGMRLRLPGYPRVFGSIGIGLARAGWRLWWWPAPGWEPSVRPIRISPE